MRFARTVLAPSRLAENLYPELEQLGHSVRAEIEENTDWLILEGATWFHFWNHPEIPWPRERTICIADQPRIVRYCHISWSAWPCTGWLYYPIPALWLGTGSDLARRKTREFGINTRPDLDAESLFIELDGLDLERMQQALNQACIPLVRDLDMLDDSIWPVQGLKTADIMLREGHRARSVWGEVSLATWRSPQCYRRSQRQWAERFLAEIPQ